MEYPVIFAVLRVQEDDSNQQQEIDWDSLNPAQLVICRGERKWVWYNHRGLVATSSDPMYKDKNYDPFHSYAEAYSRFIAGGSMNVRKRLVYIQSATEDQIAQWDIRMNRTRDKYEDDLDERMLQERRNARNAGIQSSE